MNMQYYPSTQARLAESEVAETDWVDHGDCRVECVYDYVSDSLSLHGNGGEIAAWDSLREARTDTINMIVRVLYEAGIDNDLDGDDIARIFRLGSRSQRPVIESIMRVYAMNNEEIIEEATR